MFTGQALSILLLAVLLVFAVAGDLRSHRISNRLVLIGVFVGVGLQSIFSGWSGLGSSLLGLLIGLSLFLPFYALGGMAAGDVKLMAMAGSFLTPSHALWMVFFSLMAGALCGLFWVLVRGQFKLTLSRYWLMLATRSHIAPVAGEVAAEPFPYSIAILLGVIAALVWRPFDPLQILRYSFG